jgi:hypothetical protein
MSSNQIQNDETANILQSLPGGPQVLSWFGGRANFGDAEVLNLNLTRSGPSLLRILVFALQPGETHRLKKAVVTFTLSLSNMIDVAIEGFAHQNVIGGLELRHAPNKPKHPSLFGIGITDGQHEIGLAPCAGAFGTIRATITGITIEPAP